MSEDKSPAWRRILEWGCVIYFLGLPLITLMTAFTPLEPDFSKYPEARENMRAFHIAVSALVATMAGLNTVDRRRAANGRGEKS